MINPWLKLGLFFGLWLLIWSPIALYFSRQFHWHPPQPLSLEQKIPLVLSLYSIAPFLLWATLSWFQESWWDYGIIGQWQFLLFFCCGCGGGIVGILFTFAIESQLGWSNWQLEHLHKLKGLLLPILLIALMIGGIEELIFRGFLQFQLEQTLPWLWATCLSSLIFALLHLIWDYQKTLPQLPGLLLMGILLVGARSIEGGGIALAWGLHSGWISTLSLLDSAQLIQYQPGISPWLIGIEEEPLAGVAGISCLGITGAVLYGLSLISP